MSREEGNQKNINGRIMAIRKDLFSGLLCNKNQVSWSISDLCHSIPVFVSCAAYILMRRLIVVITISPFRKIYGRNYARFAGHTRIAVNRGEKERKEGRNVIVVCWKIFSHFCSCLQFNLQLVIGQHHWINLNRVDQISVVAHNARQLDFANFLQLFGREWRRLIGQFIPETVAAP